MEHEKSCGAVMIKEQDGRIYTLVIRQNQGHWCFPKGHIKKGETEHETAAREILEETGLAAEFIDGFRETTTYHPREGVRKEVVYFLARPAGGTEKAQEEEVSEIRWTKLIDAMALITYDNDASLLRKAVRWLQDSDPRNEEML